MAEARMQHVMPYQKWSHDGQQIRVVWSTVTALYTSENVRPQLLKLKFISLRAHSANERTFVNRIMYEFDLPFERVLM